MMNTAGASTARRVGPWPLQLLAGALLCSLLLAAALLSLLWQPWPPKEIDVARRLLPPGAAHWLGTDHLGRDIFSQLLVGAQSSIAVGLLAVAIGGLGGIALGCWAAASAAAQPSGRSLLEELLMRSCDFGFAFPALLTAILLAAAWGPGLLGSALAIGLFSLPVFARLARSSAGAIWARDFVLAARAAGKGAWAISLQHVLPNIAGVLIVQATISFATAILAEAALAYLGLGTQPPQPSWGRMLADAQLQMFQAPLLALWPGLAIMLSVLGLNLLGDGLRDRLDPKLAGAR